MKQRRPPDYSLHVITDRRLARGRPLEVLVAQAIAGGATIIQLRDKISNDRRLYEDARCLRELTREREIPLIINDRIDLALAVDADGIHLGQEDMPPDVARRLLGSGKILGLSTHNEDQARAAARASPDYVAIGPIYATTTKENALPPLGTEIITFLKEELRLPIVAIGGIEKANASHIGRAGADGIAVVSSVIGADDVTAAARELLAAFRRGKESPSPTE